MDYSHIIDNMIWSYSRITTFESCPYRFLLRYILNLKKKRLFFSDYGLFMHSIIEKALKSELHKSELASYYLLNFRDNIFGKAPNVSIFQSYFSDGLKYLSDFQFPYKGQQISGVESEVHFKINDKDFVGIIDVVAEDGGVILDNKSRNLKPRSKRKKPTLSDKELDEYLKQLYIYAIATQAQYNKLPERLEFNCFREGIHISEPFDYKKFEAVKQWALDLIEKISSTTVWHPNIEYFKCHYLCDVCEHCCYYEMQQSQGKEDEAIFEC